MPVDINKWKETSLDAYLEVSPVKKLGEESGEGAKCCCKCLFHRVSVGAVWHNGCSLLPGGILGPDK